MKVGNLSDRQLATSLSNEGLRIKTGPFVFSIQSDIEEVWEGIALLHGETPLAREDDYTDYYIAIRNGRLLRRWLRPQACFEVDGVTPFKPLPRSQAFPMLEWGMNWCITAYGHHQLVLHAAVIARGDFAAILPAPPGSGKSTLCAALINRGWRLLSDELALVDLETGQIEPLARPVNLKNASIDIMRAYAPEAVFSRPVEDTTKGTVALMRAPAESVVQAHVPATPRWVILPRYTPGADADLQPMAQGEALIALAENAMNYHVLGARGFAAVGRLIDGCRAYRFSYSRLDDAIRVFDDLASAL